jgi:hypothetical protein
MRRRLLGLTLALLALGAGCGLWGRLSPITFQLPRRTFLLATDDSQWKSPPHGFSMGIDCATPDDCCLSADSQPPSCAQFPLVCASGRCAVEFPLQAVALVDFAHDAPELAQARGQVPAEVTLESLDYTVASDLNVALPEVTLYVAPESVASADSGQAHRLGVVPLTNTGFQGNGTITLDADARRAFEALARDLQTPFHLIAATTIMIRSGSPAPSGQVELSVTGKVTVKF